VRGGSETAILQGCRFGTTPALRATPPDSGGGFLPLISNWNSTEFPGLGYCLFEKDPNIFWQFVIGMERTGESGDILHQCGVKRSNEDHA
jgi:hypothetical protein